MIHVITGQTATGKTQYAIHRARELNGEILNADSRQIYKKLSIITGKDLEITTGTFTLWKKTDNYDIGYYTLKEEPDVKIWLYDILDPRRSFSSFEYRLLAQTVIDDIISRNKVPILVGGTYFYIQDVLSQQSRIPVPPDPALRNELALKTLPELQNLIRIHNPPLYDALNNSEKHNPQRLIRRIEIERGRVPHQSSQEPHPSYNASLTGFSFNQKANLRDAITQRVHERIEKGALKEVENLLRDGYTMDDPGLKTIGYSQMTAFCKGTLTWEESVTNWITKEVQYAKRQLTFMKRNPEISWHFVDA